MRRLLFVLALAGCGHSRASGPAWPAPSTTAEDGGESLDPRPSASYAAAVEKSEEPEPAKEEPAADEATAPEADSSEAPDASEAAEPDSDEPVTTEEITIEIDDDE